MTTKTKCEDDNDDNEEEDDAMTNSDDFTVEDASDDEEDDEGTIEEDEETFDWWFTEYVWKDYSCEETPPPLSIATYDPEQHMFVSQCREN